MAWDENKKIKFVIDHNKVDDTLHDFPVTMKISDSCGINLVDLTTTSGTTASGTIFEEATSALSPNYDFTGNDGDGPDWRQFWLSNINAMTYCSIQNNKFNYSCDTAADCWIYSDYYLVGDFDIQVDFDLVTHPETNSWEMSLLLTSTGFTAYLIREYAGSNNRYRSAYGRLGASAGGTTTNRDDLSGKLRHVRTGGTISSYYWNAGWVLLSTSGFSDCTEPIRAVFRLYHSGGPGTVEYNLDNVQLNSGSVNWDHLKSKVAVYAGGDQNTGTRCFIDLDNWDTINEEIVMHIGVPKISNTEDTELHLYYDEDNNTNANGYPHSWWASLTPENASDSFPVDGTPNEALWYEDAAAPGIPSYVANGKLVMDLSSANVYDELESTYTIYGDFDVQVDWEISAQPSSDNWYIELGAEEGNEDLTDKRWFIRRVYATAFGHVYRCGYSDGGGFTQTNSGAVTTTSGTFRITREDHDVKMYYYDAGWQLLDTGTLTSLDNVPMRLKLVGWTGNNEPTYSAYFSNFTVNKAYLITDNYSAWDDFTGPDYSEPNRENWLPTPGNTAKFVLKDNSLYINDTGATSATIYNTHWLSGDFDVQVDFNLVTWPSINIGWLYMRFQGRDNNDDWMTGYCGRRYDSSKPNTNMYFASFYDNSSWTGETSVATSDTTGKFRFYRDGNTIYSQYWNGASWTTLDSEDFDSAPEVYIYLQAGSSGSNTGVEIKLDNFKVNSAKQIRGYSSSASGGSGANVWDPVYRFICHLSQYDYVLGGYANRVYDASRYHDRGTANTNMTYSDQVDSQVGKGFDLDGTDDRIAFGNFSWMDWRPPNAHSMEAVIKCDSAGAGGERFIFGRMDQGGTPSFPGYDFRVSSTGWLKSYIVVNWSTDAIQPYGDTPTSLHDDEYHYVAVRYDGSKDETGYTFYYDGQIIPNVYNVNTLTSDVIVYNSDVCIGARDTTNDFFDGVVDEVRATYNYYRPDAHFKSSYYSLFDDLLYIDWLPGPQGFDSTKYIQFFVDNSNIDNTLSNFPLRFRISNQSGIDNIDITRIFDEISYAARKKIAVTTADQTTQCYVEIEDWDDSRQEANLWIKVPSLSPQQQTEFYLYYDSTVDDNTDWVGDTGDTAAQNVWDSNFQAVYHLGEDPSGGASSMKDSTSNVRHGTPSGLATEDKVDGKSGYAVDCSGASSEIINIGTWDPGPNRMTFEFIYNMHQTPSDYGATYHSIVKRDTWNSADMRWQLNGVTPDNKWKLATNSDSGILFDYIITANEWKQLTVTYDSSAEESLYIDGVFEDSNTALPFDSDTAAHLALLQRYEQSGPGHPGKMQEVRFSDIMRSDVWIKATYHSNWDNLIYFRMPWDETHSEILMTISGSLINEDLTNFPLTLTLASGVGTNTEDVTKIFDGLTLSGTLGYSDDFTGWNGDLPDPLVWTASNGITIQSNKANFGSLSGTSRTLSYISRISGDFDIQTDFELILGPNQSAWMFVLAVSQDDGVTLEPVRTRTGVGHGYRAWENEGGGASWTSLISKTHTTGKLRVTRVGTQWTCYYDESGWQQIYQFTQITPVDDVSVSFKEQSYDTNPTINISMDNYTVVSGTVHSDQTRKKIAIFSGGDQYTGDKCFTEIEYWDAVNETATLHVQVPTLVSGTDTDLYLYEDINQPDQDYRLISEANDTFTAASGSYPDHTRWREDGGTNYFEIQNNKLYVSASSINKWLRSRYKISGDFEIHVDWDVLLGPNTNTWRVGMWVTQVGGDGYRDYGLLYRCYESSTQRIVANFKNGGAWIGSTTYGTTVTDGKFRIRRVGNIMYLDYDIGSGWVNIKSQDFSEAPDIQVIFEAVSGAFPFIGTWDNFTVISGTVTGFVGDTTEVPATEVWHDNSFVGVWHMAQDPTGGADAILNSTELPLTISPDAGDGTAYNMEAGDLIDSQVGKALEFDGVAEWVDMGDLAAADPGTSDFTVEILVKGNASPTTEYILSKGNDGSSNEGWSIWQGTSNISVRCNASDDSSERASQTLGLGVLDTNWHTVSLVLDHTDEKIYGYKDGSNSGWTPGGGGPADDDITGFDIDTADELAVAAVRDASTTDYYSDITMDEIRISSTARAPGWISTTHDSLFDDLVFYDLLPPTPPTPPTPSGLADAMGWTKVNDVLTSGIVVRLYRRTDGSLVGEDISATLSGTWNIPTTYDEYHYAVGLYPVSGTNSLIYDWLHPTLNP